MGYKFNPFTGNLDTTDSPNGVFEEIEVNGDITLDDGGTYTTTLQTITPTAARTISFPDATGTVGLVGGSSGNLVVNQSGAYAGVANSSVDNATGNITLGSRFISSLNGAASAPPGTFTGTWFTGGTATTTKPQVLIEPTGATSTAWATAGTGLGVNAASGFAGNLLDLQVNGTRSFSISGIGGLVTANIGGSTFVGRNSTSFGINVRTTIGVGTNLELGVGNTSTGAGSLGSPSLWRDGFATAALYGSGGTTDSRLAYSWLIYNSRVSATDYERAVCGWTGGAFYGTISGTTLTLTNTSAYGDFKIGQRFAGLGITDGTTITAQLSGALGAINSTYTISNSHTIATVTQFASYDDAFLLGTSKGSTGGTARPLALQTDDTARLTVGASGGFTIADANDIAVGTTTGTKIGTATTQKLGFFDKTPVVQPTAVADATDAATAITQLNALLARMRDLGLIAT